MTGSSFSGLARLRGLLTLQARRDAPPPLGAEVSAALDHVRRMDIAHMACIAQEPLRSVLRQAISEGRDIVQVGCAPIGSTSRGIATDGGRFDLDADVRIAGDARNHRIRLRGEVGQGIDMAETA